MEFEIYGKIGDLFGRSLIGYFRLCLTGVAERKFAVCSDID